jgi:Sel1 repeat
VPARRWIAADRNTLSLIDRIYGAADDPETWPGVLRSLCPRFSASKAVVISYDFIDRKGSRMLDSDPDPHFAEMTARYCGKGTPRDIEEACGWYAAVADDVTEARAALVRLGRAADGPDTDDDELIDQFVRAERGDAEAQLFLSERFMEGDGVDQDLVDAAKWCEIALSSASDSEIGDRARDLREELAALMTSAEADQASLLSRDWQRKG